MRIFVFHYWLLMILFTVVDLKRIDLQDLFTGSGIRITGERYGDRLGTSVAMGNVNGDGYKDVLIGAPSFQNNTGAAYLIFGKSALADISLSTLSSVTGIRYVAPGIKYRLGQAVDIGDINNDGYGDMAFGAPSYSSNTGIIYIVYGSASPNSISLGSLTSSLGVIINGPAVNTSAGFSLTMKFDYNTDGRIDPLVSTPQFASYQGRTYLLVSPQTSPVSMSSIIGDKYLSGETANVRSGYIVTSGGDINGDGKTDFIIGAPNVANGGKGYVLFGGLLWAPINLQVLNTYPSYGFVISSSSSIPIGTSFSCSGDVNGDGMADILVGSPTYSSNTGMVYVIFGKSGIANLALPTLTASDGFSITGFGINSQTGAAVAIGGDFNNNGISDMVISATGYASNTGAVFVVYGRTNIGSVTIDLTTFPSMYGSVIYGEGINCYTGYALNMDGDGNGDGYADLLIGAPGYDNNRGRVYLIFGASTSNKIFLTDPSSQPTSQPSIPTGQPSSQPSNPTGRPSSSPTNPTTQPSSQPSRQPTSQPTAQPSRQPFCRPTSQPSRQPSSQPSLQPFSRPTGQPSQQPTSRPSLQPTGQPTTKPSRPTLIPTIAPTFQPSISPSSTPTVQPSSRPSREPTGHPSLQPFSEPTSEPSNQPVSQPSTQPSSHPTRQPTCQPSVEPTSSPTIYPSSSPTSHPSSCPTCLPGPQPTMQPTCQPSIFPTSQPVAYPSCQPTTEPTKQPSSTPSDHPTVRPSPLPSAWPSYRPSSQPTRHPTSKPSNQPTIQPSSQPSLKPFVQPSSQPTQKPTSHPTVHPTVQPPDIPTRQPTSQPTLSPTCQPSIQPTSQPSSNPFGQPTIQPSSQPSLQPSVQPSSRPSRQPTAFPIPQPTSEPLMSLRPTSSPSIEPFRCTSPTAQPTPTWHPSELPTSQPLTEPPLQPSSFPSDQPLSFPSSKPTSMSFDVPSRSPSCSPFSHQQSSIAPSSLPGLTHTPTSQPSELKAHVSGQPTAPSDCTPTSIPGCQPTNNPSSCPSCRLTGFPTSSKPSPQPSHHLPTAPSGLPTWLPSSSPSNYPTSQPNTQPTQQPTSAQPTRQPSSQPSRNPTRQPISTPTTHPSSSAPSAEPTEGFSPPTPIRAPSITFYPTATKKPTRKPTLTPTRSPTFAPTSLMNVFPLSYSYRFRETLFLLGRKGFGSEADSSFIQTSPFDFTRKVSNQQSFVIFGSSAKDYTAQLVLGSDQSRGYSALEAEPVVSIDTISRCATAIKDFNGDKLWDLFVGYPDNSQVLVYLGQSSEGFSQLPVSFVIYGVEGEGLGWAITDLGDINGGSLSDVMVSAVYRGVVYIIYGRSNIEGNNIFLENSFDGFRIIGVMPGIAGTALTSLDFNGDGVKDFVISSLGPTAHGRVRIIYGNSSYDGMDVNLEDVTTMSILFPPFSFAGFSIAGVGDMNGDGYDDLAIGSVPYQGGFLQQITYVIYGNSSKNDLFITKLSRRDGFVVIGAGFLVNDVGDLNGDGLADLLVTNYHGWERGISGGNAYLVHLPSNMTSAPSLLPSSYPTSLPSVSPSTSPSMCVIPTSIPTEEPTFPSLLNESRSPILRPTIRPTMNRVVTTAPVKIKPTNKPTEFSSNAPSPLPTLAPSTNSDTPTLSPTRKPRAQRSHNHQTAAPTGTLMPTINYLDVLTNRSIPLVTLFCSHSGSYAGSPTANYQFIVSGKGNYQFTSAPNKINVYVFIPMTNTIMLFGFQPELDRINLCKFPKIKSLDDISYTTNPFTIFLSKEQILVFSSNIKYRKDINLDLPASSSATSSQDFPLSTNNFIFSTVPIRTSSNNRLQVLIIIGGVCLLSAVICAGTITNKSTLLDEDDAETNLKPKTEDPQSTSSDTLDYIFLSDDDDNETSLHDELDFSMRLPFDVSRKDSELFKDILGTVKQLSFQRTISFVADNDGELCDFDGKHKEINEKDNFLNEFDSDNECISVSDEEDDDESSIEYTEESDSWNLSTLSLSLED